MIARALLVAGMILVAAPALAADKTTFTVAKDAKTVFQGSGKGSVQTVDGIDWWVSGQPARKFRQIGTIRDARAVDKGVSTVVGASDLNRLIGSKGGNAAIVFKQERRKAPAPAVFAPASQNYGPTVNVGAPVDEIVTTLVVIKYVE